MKVAAYVMQTYAKAGRVGTRVGAKNRVKRDSHDRRAWPGFEMVLDAVRRSGRAPEYAGMATVHQFDVALVSITSDCDWWPYVAERCAWKSKPSLVIAGGAGVLNVRPYLRHVDCFVMGRGEVLVPAILDAHENGERFTSPSVIWSDSFDVGSTYKIMQADGPYPHDFLLTNGKVFSEKSIGCPNRCLFCGYTWHRKYIGDGTFKASDHNATGGSSTERTIIDLLKLPPERWQDDGPLGMVGLDGMSERLRRRANKPITRDMLREFLRGMATLTNEHQVKFYCIIGYPTETEDDWFEFLDDIRSVDAGLARGKQWSILLHCTPFRAMPATPASCWPMALRDLRGMVSRRLKNKTMPGNVFYQGNRFWAVESLGTDSLPTVIHSALVLRGTEAHANNMDMLARSKKYWAASRADKMATLEGLFDLGSLFGPYTAETLPTRYLPCRKWNAPQA